MSLTLQIVVHNLNELKLSGECRHTSCEPRVRDNIVPADVATKFGKQYARVEFV